VSPTEVSTLRFGVATKTLYKREQGWGDATRANAPACVCPRAHTRVRVRKKKVNIQKKW